MKSASEARQFVNNLTLMLIGLKVAGLTDLPWWIVLAGLWIPATMIVVLTVIIGCLSLLEKKS